MKIAVIGAGYVGLVTGACLAKLGNQLILVDSDRQKAQAIQEGKCPIYEDGLQEILDTWPLQATWDIAYAVQNSELSFICVPTGDGSHPDDLNSLLQVSRDVGRAIKRHHLIVVKSTVPPGTTQRVVIPTIEAQGKALGEDFTVCVNPEFLREGRAVHDFLHPSRVIIGEAKNGDGDTLVELYRAIPSPIIRVDLATAEMVKYASNAFLAMRVSFMNEIGNICKRLGLDADQVARGMGYDRRIGQDYLKAGIGYGGSCLPKDLRSLIATGERTGYRPRLLEEIDRLNNSQPHRLIELLKKHLPQLKDKSIGVLGLAFKADTDDVRESKAIEIVRALLEEGAKVKAYDPAAMANFRRLFPHIEYAPAPEVLKSEAVLIITDWKEFHSLDYRGQIVIDGRRIDKAREARIYEGICW